MFTAFHTVSDALCVQRGFLQIVSVSPAVQNYEFVVDSNLKLFCLVTLHIHNRVLSLACESPFYCFLTLNEDKYSSNYHLPLVLIKPLYQLLLCFGI